MTSYGIYGQCYERKYDYSRTYKGTPSTVPWDPYVAWDCNNSNGQSQRHWLMNADNPHGYSTEMYPNCSFSLYSTPEIVLGNQVKVSATVDNCEGGTSSIAKLYSTTVTHTISDMYGSQSTVRAEFALGDKIKAGIEQSFQYQRTVSDSTAVTDTSIYTFNIAAGKKGYVAFSPRFARAKGKLTATYPKLTHGKTVWSDPNIVTNTPIYIPGTNFADGVFKMVYEPC
ncbi:hypothetical protein ACIRU3_46370 [Streptomyces sp. NPDC101151]|uniref:hypothetical protein n=1 Tax=Streptomyces sp. NPDC101151 TaxID=3366115 RepID=UPI003829A80E